MSIMSHMWSSWILLSALFFIAVPPLASAQDGTSPQKSFGAKCDPKSFGYNAALTYFDDCNNVMLACSNTGTCTWKTCRTSDYVSKSWNFAINPNGPVRCPSNQFCPDDGSACQNLLPMGSSCQPQRDDQCLPQNTGICMNSFCFSKSVGLGGSCGVEKQQYNYYYQGIGEVVQNIFRDNCTSGMTCDTTTSTCKPGAADGTECTQDRECASATCSSGPLSVNGVCVQPPDTYNKLTLYQWIGIGAGVFAFVILTLVLLFILHRFQRRLEKAKIAAFYGAQDDFKRDMGYSDYDDARSSIVLATPQSDFKRRSATNLSAGSSMVAAPDIHLLHANASRQSLQSEAGIPGRPNTVLDPDTGRTHAEDVKLQYQQHRQSWATPTSSSRRSHPLMNATMATAPETEEL